MSPKVSPNDPRAPAQSALLWRLLQATASAVQATRQGRSLTAQLENVSQDLRWLYAGAMKMHLTLFIHW
jgi:fumarate hydratase class II